MTVECLKISLFLWSVTILPAVPSLKVYQDVFFKARMTQTTFAEEELENTHNFLGLLS